LTTNIGGVVSTVFVTGTLDTPTGTSFFTMPLSSSNAMDAGGVRPMEPSTLPNAGLQKEAKIGTGVGSVVGAVFVGTLLWYYISCMRKRCKRKLVSAAGARTGSDSAADADRFAEKDHLGDDDLRSPAWPGPKPELPTVKDLRSPTLPGYKSELPADKHEVRSPIPVYEPYGESYRSSPTAETEGSQRYEGQGERSEKKCMKCLDYFQGKRGFLPKGKGLQSYQKLRNDSRMFVSVCSLPAMVGLWA
jgi:hypothetical protein